MAGNQRSLGKQGARCILLASCSLDWANKMGPKLTKRFLESLPLSFKYLPVSPVINPFDS